MKEMMIRTAEDADLEPARRVLREAYGEYASAFPEESWLAYLQDILDLEARASASDLLIAELDGEVVACVSYYPPGAEVSYPSDSFSLHWPGEWASFRLLAVDPSARGSGVGRALTEACLERARSQGAVAVGLHTTVPMALARAMYERMGFVRSPRYDFRPTDDLLVEAYALELSRLAGHQPPDRS